LQHGSGAPSRASIAVAESFPGEPLSHQNRLRKIRRILHELNGAGPVEAADPRNDCGHVAATDLDVSTKSGNHLRCLDLSGNLGEDSGGIHSQDRTVAVIQPPSQVRPDATINQGRDHQVGVVRGLEHSQWTGTGEGVRLASILDGMIPLQLPSPLVEIRDACVESRGVRLYLKRDDLIHAELSGNKWRKLKYNIGAAQEQA
jgi:hypothetical protein